MNMCLCTRVCVCVYTYMYILDHIHNYINHEHKVIFIQTCVLKLLQCFSTFISVDVKVLIKEIIFYSNLVLYFIIDSLQHQGCWN